MLSEKAAATPDPEGNFIERYIAEQQRAKRDVQGPKKWFAAKEGPRQEQAIFSGSVNC